MEKLTQVAKCDGVIAEGLALNWNHVFRPMPANAGMGHAHKAMLGHLKDRGMAMTIAQMLPARAAMVEYALTRRVNTGLPGRDTPKSSSASIRQPQLTWSAVSASM